MCQRFESEQLEADQALKAAMPLPTLLICLIVGVIALHGLGLYIYAGEDLPQIGTEPAANDSPPSGSAVPASPALVALPGKRINAKQQDTIARLALEVGVELARVLEYFGVGDVCEIASADYLRVVRSLEKRRSAA